MIKSVKKWVYNGTNYDTEEEATMAAILDKLGDTREDPEAIAEAIRTNATELVNLISVFSRRQVRVVA